SSVSRVGRRKKERREETDRGEKVNAGPRVSGPEAGPALPPQFKWKCLGSVYVFLKGKRILPECATKSAVRDPNVNTCIAE
nr:hypothetical protein [Proteus mirabilis]